MLIDKTAMDAAGTIHTSTTRPSVTSHFPERMRRRKILSFGRADSQNATDQTNPGISSLVRPAAHQDRPHTSQSDRRKPGGLPFEGLRKSLSVRKRGSSCSAAHVLRPSSRQSQSSKSLRQTQFLGLTNTGSMLLEPTSPSKAAQDVKEDQSFKSAREYYQHLKKSSISHPFNFQHVTHTAKKHLPRLDTVDEKDLKNTFWAISVYQKPTEEVHGIKVEDLKAHRQRSLPPQFQPAELRHAPRTSDYPVSSIVNQTFLPDLGKTLRADVQRLRSSPDNAYQPLEKIEPIELQQNKRVSIKHHSKISTRTWRSLLGAMSPDQCEHESFDDSKPVELPASPETHQTGHASLPIGTYLTPKSSSQAIDHCQIGQGLHEQDRSPQVARQADTQLRRASQTSPDLRVLESPLSSVRTDSLFSSPPRLKAGHSITFGSECPSPSARLVNKSSLSCSIEIETFSATSWEDDVDFAYEQAAEAMCDFDWANVSTPRDNFDDEMPLSTDESSLHEIRKSGPEEGVYISAWCDEACTCSSDLSRHSSNHPSQKHKRGSSIGHKGFAAARNASATDICDNSSPASHIISTNQLQTSPSRSKANVTDTESPAYQSPYNSSTLYFPTFDGSISEGLSDPESISSRRSRHCKSSSYDSCESSGRSAQTSSDTGNWSFISTTSAPGLTLSEHRIRPGLRAQVLHTLESVPHNPAFEPQTEEIFPPPPREPFMMRRPASAGDRYALYTAGRVVQRGRSCRPSPLRQRRSVGGVQQVQEEAVSSWI